MSRRRRLQLVRFGLYALTVVAVLTFARQVDWEALRAGLFKWDAARDAFPDMVRQGARNTLIYTFFGFSGALALGLLLAVMRLSSFAAYRWSAAVYVEVVRGIPLLLWLILLGFGIRLATGFQWPGTYTAGSVVLALVGGAYVAETIRAGIEAVPRGQMEAARSLGMRHSRAMITVVIPQAFRITVPPLTNELVLLLKDTALISVLGVTYENKELFRFARDAVNQNANSTPLVVAGLIYLAMTIPLTRLAAALERRNRAAR